MSESLPPSSSSSLTDGLSFILDEDRDDIEVLKHVLDDETNVKTIQLPMKWIETT